LRNLTVTTANASYDIYIGSDLFSSQKHLKPLKQFNRFYFIVDENLIGLTSIIDDSRTIGKFVVASGESNKSFENYYKIQTQLIEKGFRRNDTIIALGGGVVGDLAGFVAATYQRGCSLIQIPTTLLSTVDSSVGGKTAINHPLGKNLIGSIYQPSLVLIDPSFFATLPKRQIINGMAEVVKYAILGRNDLFQSLETLSEEWHLANESLEDIIFQCISIKAEYVKADEKDFGIRNLLNFGHTFAHAIEQIFKYENILHGEAVAIGMSLAARYSYQSGYCDCVFVERLETLLSKLRLPYQLPEKCSPSIMVENMSRDKKNMQNGITLVLTRGIGECFIQQEVNPESIFEFLYQQTS